MGALRVRAPPRTALCLRGTRQLQRRPPSAPPATRRAAWTALGITTRRRQLERARRTQQQPPPPPLRIPPAPRCLLRQLLPRSRAAACAHRARHRPAHAQHAAQQNGAR
jgi:hypothetical protein